MNVRIIIKICLHNRQRSPFRDQNSRLPHTRPAAALALYDLVALLQQALALAILALLLLLDVGALIIGHGILPSDEFVKPTMIEGRVLVYKHSN